MIITSEEVRRASLEEGFSLCGIARARVLTEREEPLRNWIAADMAAGMDYMVRTPERRIDPAALVEGARTVVVCAVNYKNGAWNQTVSPRIASYAYAPDYHTTIVGMLNNVLGRLPEGVHGRAFCDTAPILEKAWATEAGLGATGKNSLLITPEYGSFVLLGVLVLDARCDDYDAPFADDLCGRCTLCVDTCPTRAIVAPRVIDTRRCISRMTLEKNPRHSIDLNGWLAGCDACQSCCPHNRNTPLTSDPRFTPVIPAPASADFWRTLTRDEFDRIFSITPLARRGYDALKAAI